MAAPHSPSAAHHHHHALSGRHDRHNHHNRHSRHNHSAASPLPEPIIYTISRYSDLRTNVDILARCSDHFKQIVASNLRTNFQHLRASEVTDAHDSSPRRQRLLIADVLALATRMRDIDFRGVDLSWRTLDNMLLSSGTLKRLNISGQAIPYEAALMLRLPQLEELDISECYISNRSVRTLFLNCPNLLSIYANRLPVLDADSCFANLPATCRRLEHVGPNSWTLSLRAIARAGVALEHLVYEINSLNGYDSFTFDDLARLQRLKTLRLTYGEWLYQADLRGIEKLRNLRALSIRASSRIFSSFSMQHLVTHCTPDLEHLSIDVLVNWFMYPPISDAEIETLAARCRKLQTLHIVRGDDVSIVQVQV